MKFREIENKIVKIFSNGYWRIEIINDENKFSAWLSCNDYDYKQCMLAWNNAGDRDIDEFINYVLDDISILDAQIIYLESLRAEIANFGNRYNGYDV